MKKKDVLREKSFSFALRIVNLNKFLVANYREYVLSKQVLRSGTSIGANLAEARRAQSGPDFVHKLSISNKEASETKYWLELLEAGGYVSSAQAQSLICECVEIQKLLTRSIDTTRKNSS